MRFAVVLAPSGDSSLTAERVGALRERLMRGGFNAMNVSASANAARDLARAIDGVDEDDSLLVYIAGEMKIVEEKAALRMGESELGLDAIGAILRARRTQSALLILDVHHAGEADDAMNAAEHVDAALHALDARGQGLEVLIGAHATKEASWPFTRLLTQALDDGTARDGSGAATGTSVYARVKEMPELAASVPSFAHTRGAKEIALLLAPEPIPSSLPPPSLVPSSSRSSLPPPPSSLRPPRSRSISPLPAIEPILADAEKAHAKQRWDEALDGYKKALMLLGEGDARTRASLYASVAEVKRAQGKLREAETNYEKALSADKTHLRSIEALIVMAAEAKEWMRAIAHRKRLVDALSDPSLKAKALMALAHMLENDVRDPKGAAAALEQANAVLPDDFGILEKLQASYEAMNRWTGVVDVLGRMADAAATTAERTSRKFQQADVTLARLRDEEAGLALLDSVLADDPTHERALSGILAVRGRRQEWLEIDKLYARLVDRFAERGDWERAWDACKKLGMLRRDRLFDGPGAIDAWQGALRCKVKDVETRAALAELYVAKGDMKEAIAELETAAIHEPLRAATHRRLFELHRRMGATDRAWLAAAALEELEATNGDQEMLLQQFRPEGGVRPTAALDDDAWEKMRAPGEDDIVDDVMRAIAPAAVAMRVEELRVAKRLVTLDLAKKQAETSTASVVRTFAFASQVLAVPLPYLYAEDDVPGGVAAVQVEMPSTVIGPPLMSGKSLQELGFVVARHLAYHRPEHYVLVFFPTVIELTALFLAAVKLALPEVPVPTHAAAAAAKLRKELEKHATPAMKVELAAAVERLNTRGGKVDLAAWIRGVELTATRAGMLMCGDLAVAMRELKRETRTMADVALAEKRADLLTFSASKAIAELRAQLGVAAKASVHPPEREAAAMAAV